MNGCVSVDSVFCRFWKLAIKGYDATIVQFVLGGHSGDDGFFFMRHAFKNKGDFCVSSV
jgi:hypothetical protein